MSEVLQCTYTGRDLCHTHGHLFVKWKLEEDVSQKLFLQESLFDLC